MQKISILFSLNSRTSRGAFWLSSIVTWLLLYAIGQATVGWNGIGLAILNAPFLALLISLCIRRLHDRSYSGWWLLTVLIPILGVAWLVWQLACKVGVADANQWGADPRAVSSDYLTVK